MREVAGVGRVLLIDKNYMALAIISLRKSVKLLVKGKAEPLHMGMDENITSISIKTGSSAYNVPSIIRLLVNIPFRAHQTRMRFSRRNVMIRDGFNCQYCGIKMGKQGGTIDHVIPRAKGGQTNYGNCVACCKSCNNKKADKSPEEVGFKLLNRPKRPGFTTLYKNYLDEYSPEEWTDYIIGV